MLISFLDTPSERQLDASYLIDILQTSCSQARILWEPKERFKLRKRKAAPVSCEQDWLCQRGVGVARSWPESHSEAFVLSSWTGAFQNTTGRGHFVTMKKWDRKQGHSVILSTHKQNKITGQNPKSRIFPYPTCCDCCFFITHSSSLTLYSSFYLKYDSRITELLPLPERIQSRVKLYFLKLPQSHLMQAWYLL